MSKVYVPNYTQVPNVVIDEHMANLSDAAFKIYVLLIRKTKGWDKTKDAISLSQFVQISGLSRPTVVKAIDQLISYNLIKKNQKTPFGNEYELNISFSMDGVLLNFPASKNSLLVKIFNYQSKNSLLVLVKIFNTQKKTSKQTIKTKECYSEAFEKFWNEYPKCKRKGSKSDAAKTYKKFEKDSDLIFSVLQKFKLDQSFLKNDGEFIPAPSSWLNKKHWENEFWLDQKVEQVEIQQQIPQQQVKVVRKNYLGG